MADYFAQAKDWVGGMGVNFGSIMNALGWFMLLIVTSAIVGAFVYWYALNKKFNKKIIVFEKINGIYQRTKTDTAMEVNLAPGATAFYLRESKKYLVRPTIQTGVNTYWYVVGRDGNWINVGLEDWDIKTNKLTLLYDPVDVRNSRAGLQKLLKDNYKKEHWLEKYAPYIALTILILMLGVSAWLISDKLIEGIRINGENLKLASALSERQDKLLVAMENVCGGGSGLKPG